MSKDAFLFYANDKFGGFIIEQMFGNFLCSLYNTPFLCYNSYSLMQNRRTVLWSLGGEKMENKFKVVSKYKPTGDQPQAIEKIAEGFQKGLKFQTLLGVTGSGKTFTMANIIEKIQKPTLVIAHNKTLAAQLYNELKEFFPENAVEYFVS